MAESGVYDGGVSWLYIYIIYIDLISFSFPHREKKESIRLGEELVVSHSDADPARRNGECRD